MGSFDVACSMSRITINPGDPVAYMPLKLYDFAYDPRAANNTLIYQWCYYEPVCLPIMGEYFDYGFIDSIEKNSSTKAVEKHYKCPIEVVVGAQGQLPCPGMFVHREIYQTMVDSQVDQWGREEKDDKEPSTREQFYKQYDAAKAAMKTFRDIPKRKKNEEWSMEFDDTIANYEVENATRLIGFREFETFMKIYTPFISRGWMRKEMGDFLCFIRSMGTINAHFFPAANGYQWGNHYGNKVIQEKILEILNKKIEQDKKEREND